MGQIIFANGNIEEITEGNVANLQKIVNGYIDVLELKIKKDQPYSFFIINENGINQNLPKNQKATELFYQMQLDKKYNVDSELGILGNVVLLRKTEFN